jgi:uncharacterized membrane protein YgcG
LLQSGKTPASGTVRFIETNSGFPCAAERHKQASVKGILTNAYKGNATRHATICLSYINLALPSYPMKLKYRRQTPLVAAALALAALLGGCAVYPNGAPAYGSYGGYGDNGYGYGGYDGYGYGYAPPPQTNLFLGFGGYSGPSYYGGDRYGRRGYRGGDWHGRGSSGGGGGGGGHGGGGGGPHGAPQAGGGSGGGQPAAGPSGGGRGNGGGGGGNRGAKVDVSPNNGSRITNH